MRTYQYVGSDSLLSLAKSNLARANVQTPDDVLNWIALTEQEPEHGFLTTTFVVLPQEGLVISDRHSEHVACAQGRPVLSAGEMTFEILDGDVHVASVTNQSTGYCPEPESWPAVADALERAGLDAPFGFDPEFTFRRCDKCGSLNVVKESVFECAICQAPLSETWNIGP